MLCRHCGMQGPDADICDWCKKPRDITHAMTADRPADPTLAAQATLQMSAASQPTQSLPPGAQPTLVVSPPALIRRVTLTGEVVEEAVPTVQAPAIGQDYVPATLYTPEMLREALRAMDVPLGERWEKGLALCLPCIALSMLIVHQAPGSVYWVGLLVVFLLPLFLGAVRAIPSYEDAVFDSAIMMGVTFVVGPLFALPAYLLVCLIKQECNTAIVTLLGVSIAIPPILSISLYSTASSHPDPSLSLFHWFHFFTVCTAFLGWLCSSFFRPLDEN